MYEVHIFPFVPFITYILAKGQITTAHFYLLYLSLPIQGISGIFFYVFIQTTNVMSFKIKYS